MSVADFKCVKETPRIPIASLSFPPPSTKYSKSCYSAALFWVVAGAVTIT